MTEPNLIEQVLDALQRFPWKRTSNRTNIGPNIYSMVLGWVKQPFHTPAYHLSKLHNEQPEMFELLCRFVWEHDPTFTFSSITLNKDLQCPPHVDANNVGPSLIIGLGNYDGGELVVEGKKYESRTSGLNMMAPRPTGLKFLQVRDTHLYIIPYVGHQLYFIIYET